jgi:hypothetical protein
VDIENCRANLACSHVSVAVTRGVGGSIGTVRGTFVEERRLGVRTEVEVKVTVAPT